MVHLKNGVHLLQTHNHHRVFVVVSCRGEFIVFQQRLKGVGAGGEVVDEALHRHLPVKGQIGRIVTIATIDAHKGPVSVGVFTRSIAEDG